MLKLVKAIQKLAEKKDVGWLKSSQRITVDNFDHAFGAVTGESGIVDY